MDKGFDGEKLRAVRKSKGMRQNKLAEMAGISKSHLCDLERGRASPSVDTLVRLAEALGEDVSAFLK
jgi:Predicted transcriptional regulator